MPNELKEINTSRTTYDSEKEYLSIQFKRI